MEYKHNFGSCSFRLLAAVIVLSMLCKKKFFLMLQNHDMGNVVASFSLESGNLWERKADKIFALLASGLIRENFH